MVVLTAHRDPILIPSVSEAPPNPELELVPRNRQPGYVVHPSAYPLKAGCCLPSCWARGHVLVVLGPQVLGNTLPMHTTPLSCSGGNHGMQNWTLR